LAAEITLPQERTSIIDTHAHVIQEFFGDDQSDVIARAFASGIIQMVNPAVTLNSIPELIKLADRYEQLFIAVGLHPHDAKDWQDGKSASTIIDTAKHPKVVAIGECGLDFFYNHSEREVQIRVFKEQVRLAKKLDKPIIIHCRDAWTETIEILQEEKGVRGVFHCFTGTPDLVPKIKALDFYVSFSGILTFPNAQAIQAAAPLISENRFLVETDCPFLAPQKVRGQRNEPSFVWFVAEKLASLRNASLQQVSQAAVSNAQTLFRLPRP
jgi:TatD DNase family protein